ncbi:hypothetical protein Ocin01_18781 [Orchesella cincta]|uniref:Uncharacterized protein n=1 Tax=Orchesella cincta TaxID=48709 RepID=A0A1D2M4R6_ORCCI|nr:hypothetical protein Ocin01_18781 [Orchesella cincta]
MEISRCYQFSWTIFTTVIILGVLSFGQALQCYHCVHAETEIPNGIRLKPPPHPSCQRGQIPDSSLLVDCSQLQNSSTTFTCTNFVVDGAWTSFVGADGIPFRATFRGCVGSSRMNMTFTEECHSGLMREAAESFHDEEMQQAIWVDSVIFNASLTTYDGCTCNKEGGNGDNMRC